jgi:hypothetical protein
LTGIKKRYKGVDLGMGASRSWKVSIPKDHVVEVQHATHSGRVTIIVDGVIVFEQASCEPLWDTGFDHEFTLDDLPCELRIRFSSRRPAYEFFVDGRPMK